MVFSSVIISLLTKQTTASAKRGNIMKNPIVRINIKNEIVSFHKNTLVSVLSKLDRNKESYFDLTKVDVTPLCNVEQLKKGAIIEGIWDLALQAQIDADLTYLMAEYLDGNIIETDEKYYILAQKGLMSLSDLLSTLERSKITFDEWIEKYTDAGEVEHQDRLKLRLDIAERETLRKANLQEAEDFHSCATYSLPALAGKMGAGIYYTVHVPLGQLEQLFSFNEENVPIEFRAQRLLDKKHASGIADYVCDRHEDYTIPALTASVSEQMKFVAAEGFSNVGHVHIPIGATTLINDGQHRRAGLSEAVKRNPKLKEECVSVVLFYDQGLQRSQQMFADINDKMKKPSRAINVLFDKENVLNLLVVSAISDSGLKAVVDFENTTVGAKSMKIWSVLAIKKSLELLTGLTQKKADMLTEQEFEQYRILFTYWLVSFIENAGGDLKELIENISVTRIVEARTNLINTHTAYLHAVALASKELILNEDGSINFASGSLNEMSQLQSLSVQKVSDLWSGRLVGIDGKMNASATGVKLGAYVIVERFGINMPESLIEVNNSLNETLTS